MNREKKIVRTSIIGILANIILVAFKSFIGFLANSVAIILDAVNNLTDALSSIITIIGTKLSTKKPDAKHPYGHGRIEYLTNIIIAFIILFAGGMALYESIKNIIDVFNGDGKASYDYWSIIIVSGAILVKIGLGLYYRKVGKEVKSDALIGSGIDALFDALLSASTLVGIIVSLVWQVNIEGFLGIVIALFIFKSGIEILRNGVSSIVGERAEKETSMEIKKIVCSYPGVLGAYDLILNNYGHNRSIGSIHIEVDEKMTAGEIHPLTRKISEDVYRKLGIILTVGIYANNLKSGNNFEIRNYLKSVVDNYPNVKQVHGFYVDDENKVVTFDIIVEFKSADPILVKEAIQKAMKEKYPQYSFEIVIDFDFSD